MKVTLNIPQYILDEISYFIEAGLVDNCQYCNECWDGDKIIVGSLCFNEMLSKKIAEAWHMKDADVLISDMLHEHMKSFRGYK